MLSEKAGKMLNEVMVQLGREGFLSAGFIMQEGNLLAVFDNVPGSLKAESMRKLLYQVRDALRTDSRVTVNQANMVEGHEVTTDKKEMN